MSIETEVPMCSRAVSLCVHAIYPVFNSTKLNFPSAWSFQFAGCFGRSEAHSEHLFSAYSSRTLVLLRYQDDTILLFEDTNSNMRKDTSEGLK